MKNMYSTGGEASTIDLRDFKLDKATFESLTKGGEKYEPEDIEDQHKVGICTAISLTQNARKALGVKFNADFQYLLQKKYFDGNWREGSSARSALTIGKNYGLLPDEHWTHTTEDDRKKGYRWYINKLQSIPDSEINRLLEISKDYKLAGYARLDVTRDGLFTGINDSKAGIITRFVVGREWWTAPVEPLRRALEPISGHIITMCNYDGNSYRLANTWGIDWVDNGTAYGNLTTYSPTEAWIPFYNELPESIEEQKKKLMTLQGQAIKLLQQIISLLKLKIK